MNRFDPRHAKVLEVFDSYIEKAEKIHNISLSDLFVTYNIAGFGCAGKANPRTGEVMLNPHYFKDAEALKHIMEVTIGHEIAHHVDYKVYQGRGHGSSWKRVMRQLGLEPDRCHNVDLSKVGKKGFAYHCGCGDIQLGTRQHNNVMKKGAQYSCRQCKQQIVRGAKSEPIRLAANEKKPATSARKGTKGDQVKDLFAKNPGLSKVDMMNLIVDTCDMTNKGASTYYYKYK